jgi:HlyD family secretion protein
MATAANKGKPDILGAALDPVQIEKRRRARKRSRWLKRATVLVVAGALVSSLIFALRPRPVAVEMAAVRVGPMQVTVDESGRTRVRDRYVVAAPLGGELMRVTLRPGDAVETGALLARIVPQAPALLDPRSRVEATARLASAQAAAQQARAEVARVELALDHTRGDAQRMKDLAARGSISPDTAQHAQFESDLKVQELASARFGAATAQHEVEMARSALSRYGGAAKGGEAFDIVSPVAGRVLRVVQSSGGPVSPSTPLIELGDPRELEVVVDVLTEDAVRIQPGALVVLDRWGGSRPLRAHVSVVEPSAFTRLSALGVEEQRVGVVIDFDEPVDQRAALGDGYRVEAHIVTWQSDKVVVVPSSAVFRQKDGWAVFVIGEGRARLRMVGIGHRGPSDVEATSGLSPGDKVILHPSDKIEDGVRVATP